MILRITSTSEDENVTLLASRWYEKKQLKRASYQIDFEYGVVDKYWKRSDFKIIS